MTDPDPAEPAFGGRLGWGRRPALLLVDLMRAYFTSGSPLDLGSKAVVQSAAELLVAARDHGIPVVHTVVRYRAGAPDGGLFVRKIGALRLLADDAPGNLRDLMPEVAPLPTETLVIKQYASGFFGTSLAATLTAAGVDTLVIAGVSTSGCIRATATDALQYGFRPLVVADACADRTAEFHESNLRDLGAKYADVIDLAEAIAHFSA
jgi:maleamate amidohydrolase